MRLLGRLLTLGLDRFDPSDQPTALSYFTGRVETFGLGLEPQAEQRVGCLDRGRFQLFVAHFAEFSVAVHFNRLCIKSVSGFATCASGKPVTRCVAPRTGLSPATCSPIARNRLSLALRSRRRVHKGSCQV